MELRGFTLKCKKVSCVFHYILFTTVEYMEKPLSLFNTRLLCAENQENYKITLALILFFENCENFR